MSLIGAMEMAMIRLGVMLFSAVIVLTVALAAVAEAAPKVGQ